MTWWEVHPEDGTAEPLKVLNLTVTLNNTINANVVVEALKAVATVTFVLDPCACNLIHSIDVIYTVVRHGTSDAYIEKETVFQDYYQQPDIKARIGGEEEVKLIAQEEEETLERLEGSRLYEDSSDEGDVDKEKHQVGRDHQVEGDEVFINAVED